MRRVGFLENVEGVLVHHNWVEKSKKSINKERGISGKERVKILKNYKLDSLFI